MQQSYQHELPPGTRLDSFEIAQLLGTGGFGVTYRAHDRSLQRDVAIKEYLPSGLALRTSDGTTVVPRSEADKQGYQYGLRRFLDEARTLARFNHPNIVRVSRYLEANGTAYLVMDYEKGVTLAHHLVKVRTMDETWLRSIMIPLLEGLAAIHAQEFLHRDIKPGNVFLRRSGAPLLLDFGAARQALGGRLQNVTTMLTPGYAPFEQYHSDETQGPWTDIYAVGATLLHCLTGEAPPAATQRMAALFERGLDPAQERLDKERARISGHLLQVIAWMLKPYPKQRPQSAHEVLNALGVQRPATSQDGSPLTLNPSGGGGDPSSPKTVRTAPEVPTGSNLPPETLRRMADTLARYVGPPATALVSKAARSASSVRELAEFLADFVPDDEARQDFVTRSFRSEPAAANTTAGSVSDPEAPTMGPADIPSAARVGLSEEALRAAESAMAHYAGPISKVLVSRSAKKARTLDELHQLLARELRDPSERAAFLARVRE